MLLYWHVAILLQVSIISIVIVVIWDLQDRGECGLEGYILLQFNMNMV